jgi:hypothetical protein
VVFDVTENGDFITQNIDAVYIELIQETKRVFATLPKVTPTSYNGRPTYGR